jgi:hypothetical protein
VLAIEFVGWSKRVLCGIVIEYFFVLGELLLTLLAWHFRQVFFGETDFGSGSFQIPMLRVRFR